MAASPFATKSDVEALSTKVDVLSVKLDQILSLLIHRSRHTEDSDSSTSPSITDSSSELDDDVEEDDGLNDDDVRSISGDDERVQEKSDLGLSLDQSCECPESPIKTSISILPDDLLLKIFGELTTEERAPLGTSCKRFRELDFELGNKAFDTIECDWTFVDQVFTGKGCKFDYTIQNQGFRGTIEGTRHNMRLFRRATANSLKIQYATSKYDQDAFHMMACIFKTVKYNYLHVVIECDEACPENFIPDLIKNRNRDNSQIYLKWTSLCAAHDITRTRNLLCQLPKIDKFRLGWVARTCMKNEVFPEECILDDSTILHIVANTNHAELANGDVSPEGILKIFEMVCNSSLNSKFVSFYVPKTTITSLFSMQNLRYDVDLRKIEQWEPRFPDEGSFQRCKMHTQWTLRDVYLQRGSNQFNVNQTMDKKTGQMSEQATIYFRDLLFRDMGYGPVVFTVQDGLCRPYFFYVIELLHTYSLQLPRKREDLTDLEMRVLKQSADFVTGLYTDFESYDGAFFQLEQKNIDKRCILDGMVHYRLEFFPLLLSVVGEEQQSIIRATISDHCVLERMMYTKYVQDVGFKTMATSDERAMQMLNYARAYEWDNSIEDEYSLSD